MAYTNITSGLPQPGIDVSKWQGTIDWSQVKGAGYVFAFMKATEGTSYTDPPLATNVQGCWNYGIPVGFYHFAKPTAPFDISQATKEADHFVDTVMAVVGYMGDMFPVLDIEWPTDTTSGVSAQQILDFCVVFCDRVIARTGRTPMIYTGTWFINQNNGFNGANNPLKKYPLWVAQYNNTGPTATTAWDKWYVWQRSDKGQIAGITENTVDLNDGPNDLAFLMPPAAPKGLVAAAGDGEVTLSWTISPEPDVIGYDVYRNGKKVNGAILGTHTYTITGLSNGVKSDYYVVAKDSFDDSPTSATVSATPQAPPAPAPEPVPAPAPEPVPAPTEPTPPPTEPVPAPTEPVPAPVPTEPSPAPTPAPEAKPVDETGKPVPVVNPGTPIVVRETPTVVEPVYQVQPITSTKTAGWGLELLVKGIDYARFVDVESVSATNNVIMTQDSMNFTVYLNGELPIPRVGMEVVWRLVNYETRTEDNREFAGVIVSVKESTFGTTLVYEVGCESYLRWFDRKLITGVYQEQPAETTIKQIVHDYCPGFSTGNVEKTNLMLVPQYLHYQYPSQAIKLIADQTQRGWYIDYYRSVHFFRFENFHSPLPNNLLLIDTDMQNYGELEFFEDGEQVFNRFFVRGYKQRAKASYTLLYTGDGETKQWSLGYRISSGKGDTVVKVDGKAYPVERDLLDGIPGQSQKPGVAFIHYTQHLIRFAIPPLPGEKIEVTFHPLVDKFRVDQDDESIQYMKNIEDDTYSDGIYEYSTFDKSLFNSTDESVTQKLSIMALKYGRPTIRGSMTSYLDGWRAGQIFRMKSDHRFGGISADDAWFVHKVTKKWIQNKSVGVDRNDSASNHPIAYQIEFANKPYMV